MVSKSLIYMETIVSNRSIRMKFVFFVIYKNLNLILGRIKIMTCTLFTRTDIDIRTKFWLMFKITSCQRIPSPNNIETYIRPWFGP